MTWLYDPSFWASALSTLGSVASSVYGHMLQRDAYRRGMDAWRANMTAAQQHNQAIQEYLRNHLAYQTGLRDTMMGLVDYARGMMTQRPRWQDYYTPMSEAARAAARRGAMTSAQLRGVGDSAYADALAAEVEARGEQDRVLAAMGLGDRVYASQLSALGPLLSGLSGAFVPPAIPPQPAMIGTPPPAPYQPTAGGFNALGDYIRWRQMRDAIDRSRGVASSPAQTMSAPRTYQDDMLIYPPELLYGP